MTRNQESIKKQEQMKLYMLANLRHFQLNECSTALLGKLNFTNDKTIVQSFFLKQPIVVENVGSQFFNNYLESDLAYEEISLRESDLSGLNNKNDFLNLSNKTLSSYTGFLSDYLSFLWFVKDNSVGYDSALLFIQEHQIVISSLNLVAISNCYGEFSDEKFSPVELNRCFEIAQNFKSNVYSNVKNEIKEIVVNRIYSNSNMSIYNENNRIERAFIFLQSLRATNLLPHKIALYIPVFECLFSTDSNEVTHKVSERVAQYIGTSKEHKLEIFKTLKSCYDLRSKFFHGSLLSSKHNTNEKQRELAKKIDNICREVLLKAIEIDSEIFKRKDEQLVEYFDNLIFS